MNIKMEVVYSIIYAGSGFVVGVIFSAIIKRKKKINKQTSDARQRLRNIYSKYSKELYTIFDKIDKTLGVLEQ